MTTELRLRLAEFGLWVVAASSVVVSLTFTLGYAAGGAVSAKYALFFVGVLLFGVGSLGIQPTPPHRDRRRFSVESDDQHRFEAYIQEIPPLRGERLRFDQRVGRGKKIFVTSLVVLAVSAVMEFGFGVTP